MTPSDQATPPRLRRVISFPLLVLYGLGTTVGAGIYALVGVVAGAAGMHAPAAYVLASVLAAFTALTFAEFSSRVPRAAGEAAYVRVAFGRPWLATLVGLLVALAACVSAATVANGFVGYLSGIVAVPAPLAVVVLVATMGAVAALGIRESVWLAGALTLLELFGLVVVIIVGRTALAEAPIRLAELVPAADPAAWRGVLAATLLCFYAFMGFEDMVNVAEEVRDVHYVLPRAILCTLGITAVLYVLLAMTAVMVVPPEALAASEAPLALVYERAGGRFPLGIAAIATLAMVNGALIQLVKAARVLYGLADQGALPAALRVVHPRRRTPVRATFLVTGAIGALALAFPLATLAEATAAVTLVVFALINGSLVRLKLYEQGPRPSGLPIWVPLVGMLTSVSVLGFEVLQRFGIS